MEAALGSKPAHAPRHRATFLAKLAAAASLVILADRFFYLPEHAGATLGLFAFALIAATVALRPELRPHRAAWISIVAASYFALVMVEDPGLLSAALFWIAISLSVLLPRASRFGSGWTWILPVVAHTLTLPIGVVRDVRKLRTNRRRTHGSGRAGTLATIALPVVGSIVFLSLFAIANPLIEQSFGRLDPLDSLSPSRIGLWLFILMLVWRLLRPRLLYAARSGAGSHPVKTLPGVSTASVTLSLLAFNGIFALQNALDFAFLWSGTALPDGMTLAEYAHRGAYPLIATALLAALFVLVTLRPGSALAVSPQIRLLVSLWIAQNVFLVASTMLRTIAYIEAYSLTELRIEALIWMGLVAVGLFLICARLWLGKSETWLINANLAAAALALSISAALDYDRAAAGWNVTHAREVGGTGASLDLCYLNQMGPSALLPLIELEQKRLPTLLRLRVSWLRNDIMDRLEARQRVWQSWTWRGSRRLAAARQSIAEHRLPRFEAAPRLCDGSPYLRTPVTARPVPPIEVAPPPLTAEQSR